MPHVTLRTQEGTSSQNDIVVSVQDKTFEYLRVTVAPAIRVSAYLEEDLENVDDTYAELHVEGDLVYTVLTVVPGSRTRKGIELPGAMFKGEQLTIEVKRPLKQ